MRMQLTNIALVVVASAALSGQQNPFVGRWNLTGTGPDIDKVYWLEVTENGRALAGRFLNRTAHATPLAWIRMEGDELVFQYGRGEGSAEDPVRACGPIYRARLDNGKLIGRHTPEPCNLPPRGAAGTPPPASPPGPPAKPINWVGVRQPVWPPSNANANHTYGKPVVLVGPGVGLEVWTGRSEKGAWKIVDGVLLNEPPTYNPVSKEKFKDFKVEAEFKLDQDQNSGLYLRGRYELQLALGTGPAATAGRQGLVSIYGWKAADVYAGKPAGEWQALEAIVVGNRITATLNGQRVHDNAILPAMTGGALDNDELSPGPIMIQGDHSRVSFRKLVVTPIVKPGLSQSQPATRGPAIDGSPAWFLQGSFPDPTGRTIVDANGHVTVPPRGSATAAAVPGGAATPACRQSPLCGRRMGRPRQSLQRVQWEQTMGYTFTYPYVLPPGFGGVPAVALDSKRNLWVFQRADPGKPQLFKFDANYKLILQVGPDVIGYQDKAHGMAVDAEDNVWITAANGATVMKISPEGKLLLTIGVRGRRGDWDEAKGQRLLWQPVMIAFAPNGDVYIGEGHANESPNDTDSDDPANNIGAARIIHLDKHGKFINQWFGNEVGQGKFSSAHGLAVDPTTGDVWIGDREEYRIVVYSGDGKFLKTMQMRNLVCALNFDSHGEPWMASGQDGQFLKLDRNGKVLGAIGNGMGIGPGQFIEASYWAMDKDGNLYAGDTSVGRVTKMVAPTR